MKRYFKIILILTLLTACHQPASAMDYLVRGITLADGLSQSTVSDLTVDSRGYLWAGTKFGLNRCDFSNVRNYYHDPANPGSIPENRIRNLFCDSRGNLWVSCETGTAYRKEGSGEFITVPAEDGGPLMSRSFYEEKDGVLIGASGGIYYHDHETGRNLRLQTRGGSTYTYKSITHCGGGIYILATRWDGVYVYDRHKALITRAEGIAEKNVTAVGLDRAGNLWVASHGHGVTVYDKTFKPLKRLTVAGGELGSDIVLDISPSGQEMWLATDGDGINVLDSRFARKDTPALRNLGSVTRIYRDPSGNIFAGTVRSGVAAVTRTGLTTDSDLPGNPRQLGPVTCIKPLWDNKILVGSDGEGLFVFDAATGSYKHLEGTKGWKVTDLCRYGEHGYLVSTFDRGFRIVDPETGGQRQVPEAMLEMSRKNVGSGLTFHMSELGDGRIAIVLGDVSIFTPATGEVRNISLPGPTGYANPFYVDSNRLLLYSERSVMAVDLRGMTSSTMFTMPKGVTILAACYDSENDRICLGTDSGLMTKSGTGELTREMPESGLMPERITALALDADGNLWAGAGTHLVMFGKDGRQTMAFGKYDGVTPNEYLPNATFSDGNTTYIGGVNGLLRIDRAGVMETLYGASDLKPVVAEVTVDGLPVTVDEQRGSAAIPPSNGSVKVTVLDRGANALRGRIYRFHISGPGYDKDITTMERTLNLNVLKPGSSYKVSLSCGAPDGSWSEPVSLLTLKVGEIWWRSWWFTALCIAVLVLGWGAAWMRVRRRRLALAEKQRLESRRRHLENQVEFLVATNQALRTPLTMIYAPVKNLLERLRNGEKVEIEETLQSVYVNSKRMRDVIDHNLEPAHGEESGDSAPETAMAEVHLPEDRDDVTGNVDLSMLTALVVEKDAELCLFIATELKRHFGDVIHTFNGNDAMLALKQYHPDIVIASVELPGIDGLKLCRTIKKSADSGHIPVILLTALRRDSILEKGYGAGADSHLSKPFDMNVLLLRCRNLLHTRRVIRTRYEGDKPASAATANVSNADENFMRKINRLIDEEMENPDFCVDKVVESVGMSRTAFYGRFKSVAGMSIGTYVTERKVMRAKELLGDANIPVAEISERLGFSSQRYFSTFFKEKTGFTPTSFRKEKEAKVSKEEKVFKEV